MPTTAVDSADSNPGTYQGGFTTGQSSPLASTVFAPGGNITLFLSMPYPIQPGDTFAIVPGCDKLFNTCKVKFNNAVNFRGENAVPSPDHQLDYPDLKVGGTAAPAGA